MLKVKNLYKTYGADVVLSDISFSLGNGQKVALVGSNGSGKSTLLKILAGEEDIDGGEFHIPDQMCVGYLPQDTSLTAEVSVRQYLREASGIDGIEKELEELASRLSDSDAAIAYGDLQDIYLRLDGYSFDHRMEIMLLGFGLDQVYLDRLTSELSSGQKSKVTLAGILLRGVDLLLLDEPTNNLDLPALIWLEDYLQKSKATVIVVSHDRKFLDRTVKKVFELDNVERSIKVSKGTYTDYLSMKSKRFAKQKEDYRHQQEEIGRLSDRAGRLRASAASGSTWQGSDNDKFLRGFKQDRAGRSSKIAKTIEKRIDRIDKVDRPVERDSLKIDLLPQSSLKSGDINVHELVVGYDDFIIGPITMSVPFGSRVGIMGLNGSGKSTLLKTIAGVLEPKSGDLEIGTGVILGNMMQEHDSLPREQVVLDCVMEKSGLAVNEVFSLLVKYNLTENQIRKPVSSLSPGGRARLMLALFSVGSVNTLLLDEPTNHLDLEAQEALEETVKTYEGTIVLVSHDRYFLEIAKLDTVYLMSEGSLKRIPDYMTYIDEAESRAAKLIRSL